MSLQRSTYSLELLDLAPLLLCALAPLGLGIAPTFSTSGAFAAGISRSTGAGSASGATGAAASIRFTVPLLGFAARPLPQRVGRRYAVQVRGEMRAIWSVQR